MLSRSSCGKVVVIREDELAVLWAHQLPMVGTRVLPADPSANGEANGSRSIPLGEVCKSATCS